MDTQNVNPEAPLGQGECAASACRHGHRRGECSFPHCDFREIGNPEWKAGPAQAEPEALHPKIQEALDRIPAQIAALKAADPYMRIADDLEKRYSERYAQYAYTIADAMIAARKGGAIVNPQEHIPGPEIKVRIKSDPGCWSVDGLNTLADGEYVFRQVAPDPEYIPSKPGAEAAAPLDAQDGELVANFEDQAFAMGRVGPKLSDSKVLEASKIALLSRLSSLRESVASLTRERDDALRQMYRAERISGNLPRIAETLKAERDAARKALEDAANTLRFAAGFMDAMGLDSSDRIHAFKVVAEAEISARKAAALSPTPSPKEAQNG